MSADIGAKVEMKLKKAVKTDLAFIEEFLISNNLPHEDIPLKIDCMFIGYEDEKIV